MINKDSEINKQYAVHCFHKCRYTPKHVNRKSEQNRRKTFDRLGYFFPKKGCLCYILLLLRARPDVLLTPIACNLCRALH